MSSWFYLGDISYGNNTYTLKNDIVIEPTGYTDASLNNAIFDGSGQWSHYR